MMDRDRRLTGYLRGQSDKAAAPVGFELNNPWRVSCGSQYHGKERQRLMTCAGREENVVEDVWDRERSEIDTGRKDIWTLHCTKADQYSIHQVQSKSLQSGMPCYDYDAIHCSAASILLFLLDQLLAFTHILISGRFLLSPSSSMQAWQSF